MSDIQHFPLFKTYIDHRVYTPLAFFTLDGEISSYTVFMAYYQYVFEKTPASTPILLSDILIQCLIAHDYYLANKHQFLRQQSNGWQSWHVPSVTRRPFLHEDVMLNNKINNMITEWASECNRSLHELRRYSEREVKFEQRFTHFFNSNLILWTLTIFIKLSLEYSSQPIFPLYLTSACVAGAALLVYGYYIALHSNKLDRLAEQQSELKASFFESERCYILCLNLSQRILDLANFSNSVDKETQDSTKQALLYLAKHAINQGMIDDCDRVLFDPSQCHRP